MNGTNNTNTTNSLEDRTDTGFYILYVIGLFSVGLTVNVLYRNRRVWLTPLWLLPCLAHITALMFCIVMLSSVLFGYTEKQLVAVSIVLSALDFVSTITMEAAFLLRMNKMLVFESTKRISEQGGVGAFFSKMFYFFLILPSIYVTSLIVTIIAALDPEIISTEVESLVFGILNLWLGINELLMHSFFVWYMLRVVLAARKKGKLIFRAILLGTASLITFAGGIVTVINGPVGTAILYFIWVWIMWIFLVVNGTIMKIMEGKHLMSKSSENPII